MRAKAYSLMAAVGLWAGTAGAANLTWDANTGSTGAQDGPGNWIGNNWWDGGGDVTWNSSTPDDATIGSGGSGGTISLGTVTAGSVAFGSFSGTYTLSGGNLTVTNTFTVGSGGNNTIVTVTNTTIQSGGAAVVGSGSSANNTFIIVGPTSSWNLGNKNLNVGLWSGTGGKGNRLLIDGAGVAGGAIVTNVAGLTIGASAGNSSVSLTNGASMFLWGAMVMGSTYYDGGANSSRITIMGGVADSIFYGSSNSFYLGYGDRPNTMSNLVLVGAGGMMTNVGYNSGNREIDFVIGWAQTGSGTGSALNNRLVVTDGGRAFMIGNLTVGYTSGGGSWVASNALVIANGGMVNLPGGLYLGTVQNSGTPSSFNSLTVTNGGQFNTGADSIFGRANAASLVANNNTAFIGGVYNGTNALWNLGGRKLTVGSGVSGATANNNSLTVGSGGILTNAGLMTVGTSAGAQYNSVTVTNGSVYSTGLTIGSASSNNTVTLLSGGRWNVLGSNVVVGAGGATGNSLAVNGGMMTNIPTLTVPAGNALSLGVGGQIFANAVTNAGTLAVGIDSAEAPDCGRLAVAGNLDITGVPLTVTVRGMGVGIHIIATYGSLTGTFVATNGMPAHGRLEYAYGGGNRIAVLVPAQGTVVVVR